VLPKLYAPDIFSCVISSNKFWGSFKAWLRRFLTCFLSVCTVTTQKCCAFSLCNVMFCALRAEDAHLLAEEMVKDTGV